MDDRMLPEPPRSMEAECALIGSMLFNPNCIDEVMEIVSQSDFYVQQHGLYFDLILEVKDEGKPIDLITVSDLAKSKHKLNCIGDLAEIARSTPSYSNAITYAKVVAQKALEREIIIAAQEIISNVYAGTQNTDEKLDFAETSIMALRKDKELEIVEPIDIVRDVINQLERQFENKGEVFGLTTGYVDIDKRFNGWRDGDLIILAGRPSMGKSTLAQNISEHNSVDKGKPVLFFSLEMSKEDIIKRSMASIGDIPFNDIRSASVMGGDVSKLALASKKISASKLYIDDRSALSLNQVKAKARRMKRKYPELCLIVIDYLQLMNAKADSREREIATISAGLKELAKELRTPILALSQLSRALEQRHDKRPIMSDLRESGAIEQDADIVIFIYRDEVYNDTTDELNIAHAITRKFRNGMIGTDYLHCEFNKMRFINSTYIPKPSKQYSPIRTGGTFNYED